MYDLIIRQVTVIDPSSRFVLDVAVADGQVAALATELSESGREEVNGQGLALFPGVVDLHVHLNEPGRADWEGFATGSAAFAAGGGSTLGDMPLNSSPPVTTVAAFYEKLTAAERSCGTDFALWAGLVPGNVSEMAALAEAGAVGFKAFLCDSGLPEFPAVDGQTLYDGMREAAALGLPVAVHAEDPHLLSLHAGEAARGDVAGYLDSRPVQAEVAAVRLALECAKETGAALHLVHLSSGEAVTAAAEARAAGVDVSVETCPHYLLFTAEDMARLGVALKCAPPLRGEADRQALWEAIRQGEVDLVGSDHSPAPPAMKKEFASAWGGVAGIQSTLLALLTEGHACGVAAEQVAQLVAGAPAARFGLSRKGRLGVGMDADFVLVALARPYTLTADDLLQRHPMSPYLGRTFRDQVLSTWVRGRRVYEDGVFLVSGGGRLVRPSRKE